MPHHRQRKHQRKAGKRATFQEDAGDRLKNREVRRAHRGEAQRVNRRAPDAGQDPACPGAGVRWSCKRPRILASKKSLQVLGHVVKTHADFMFFSMVYLCLLPYLELFPIQ